MKRLNALELSSHLQKRLHEIIMAEIHLRHKSLSEAIGSLLSAENQLVGQIFVEGAFSAKKHTSSLREIPAISPKLIDFLERGGRFNPDWRPYVHQHMALNHVSHMSDSDKPALVISAPTGAGKTESFLFPLLDDLLKNPRQGGQTGVRSIILYPMNALVADQNKRLYEYLSCQEEIRIGFYNGETPKNRKDTQRKAPAGFDKKCFVKYREELRTNPPDILITNYSMLEYMLSRPSDFQIFGSALRAIVVDEAHLYSGTLAAEVSLLLRRTIEKAGVVSSRILYLATSATLSEDQNEKKDFFAQFFHKRGDRVIFIEGEKDGEMQSAELALDSKQVEVFRDPSLLEQPSPELYRQFKDHPLIKKIRSILFRESIVNYWELSKATGGDDFALLALLHLGAKARLSENEPPQKWPPPPNNMLRLNQQHEGLSYVSSKASSFLTRV
jgi:ATP-dependent helicase YprA (DUF1998 family)